MRKGGETKEALTQILGLLSGEKLTIAEIGCWKGNITRFLAQAVKKTGGKVYGIDHWKGVKGESFYHEAQTRDVYRIFLDYLKRGPGIFNEDVSDWVCPMVMSSKDAVNIFKDETLDLVFIDADHRYEAVKHDIIEWNKKLKKGGILCGHDCEGKYTSHFKAQRDYIDRNKDKPFTNISPRHAGVVKALYDTLKDNYQIVPKTVVWWKKK